MQLEFHNLFFVNKDTFPKDRQQTHEVHHKKLGWIYYCTIILGFWLIASPPTFGYKISGMIWSDILSGFILIGLSYFALKPYKLWAQWGVVFLGIWLLVAPMIFSAKEETALLTGFLTGTLVILLSIVISGQPGIRLYALAGPDVPSGWSYNPSSWGQRIPVIFLAWIGFFVARYMGAFQLGYIDTVWDPFFGDGTRQVLTSEVSRSFPVSDATLGAFAYIMDVLFGAAGGIDRWRTMPWIVIIFGILIIPLGIVSITLIILQPLVVGAWCAFCLTSATISLIMIPFAIDEVLATVQMMMYEKKEKSRSYRTTFWFGGTMEGGTIKPKKDPSILIKHTFKSMYRDLLDVPWNLFVIMGIGVWIMTAPAVLGYNGTIADSNHFTGAIIVSFAVISMSGVARTLRFIHILFGLWLAIAPWIFGAPSAAVWNGMIAGVLLILLAFPKGEVKGSRGGFDKHMV
ncbi:MAG TPA: vitamin K epoxide reductase family protein [Balneolaceae bacterium]